MQALIKDCREHKIDLVLCKSVSRFARNLKECVATLREFQSLEVAVLFEGQNLNTMDPRQEFILSFLAAAAAEESQSKSQNIRWSRQKHLEQGETVDRVSYGYRREKPDLSGCSMRRKPKGCGWRFPWLGMAHPTRALW